MFGISRPYKIGREPYSDEIELNTPSRRVTGDFFNTVIELGLSGQNMGYGFHNSVNRTSSATYSANRLVIYPIVIPNDIHVTNLALEVTTLVALGEIKVGIYTDNGNCHPHILRFQMTVDGTSTGVKQFSTNLFLKAGLYWIASVANNSTNLLRGLVNQHLAPVLGIDQSLVGGNPQLLIAWFMTFTYSDLPQTINEGQLSFYTSADTPQYPLVRFIHHNYKF